MAAVLEERGTVLRPAPSLSLEAFQQPMAISCFYNTYIWAPFWRPALLTATTAAANEGLSVNQASVDALLYGFMGVHHGDASLENRGCLLYSQTLGQLRTLLSRSDKPQIARLATTVTVMGMYEFAVHRVMGNSPPHHSGIIWILHHCGPESFQSQELLGIFRSCRSLLACQGLWRKKRCFLEDERWKIVPWLHTTKTFEDRIMDIYVDLPGLAEDAAFPEKQEAVMEKIKALLASLQTWRKDWDATYSNTVHLVRTPNPPDGRSINNLVLKNVLSSRLEFASPKQALEILYYNAAHLYLTNLAEALRQSFIHLRSKRTPRNIEPRFHNGTLLPPNSVNSRLRPALEGLMTLSSITGLLASTEEPGTVIPPSPMAIIYREMQKIPEFEGSWEQILGRYPVFGDPEVVFGGFEMG